MNSKKICRTKKTEGVEIIILDAPGEKVNKLNEQLISEFSAILGRVEKDEQTTGILLMSGKEDNFVAGADIDMFKTRETAAELAELSRTGQEILNRLERQEKPVVCAIHGSCMGGGTELALACHYRIVTDDPATKIGLPEVNLGLLPGMGGTQRLPRLIGIQQSLTYMLTGKNMYSYQAKKTGFADEVVHTYILEKAGIEAVKKLSTQPNLRSSKKTLPEKLLEGNALGRKIIFDQARKKTAQQTKGNYPAPPKIIDSVEYGFKHGMEKGLQKESELFGELAVTGESRALVQLFFDMNNAKKNPFSGKERPVKRLAVLGAGLMGSGIAEVSADNGYDVWLKDQAIDHALMGANRIKNGFDKKVEKRIISAFERDEKMAKIHPVAEYRNFDKMDVVIEAVFEDLQLKRNIVQEVEAATGGDTIFASNTSSLPISEIAKGAKYPEHILGMHYFSPVQKMPLLEIIKTPQTADWVTATAFEIGRKQGKTVIVVNDGPGFYTTRILAPFMNEALLLLEEGASVEQVDRAMQQFGFPVGPAALFDEVGIDVGAHVADILSETFEARGAKTSKKAKELVAGGYKGKKNQKGFYRYDDASKKKKQVNEEIYQFFGGTGRKKLNESDIQNRLVLTMVNEAVYCLQENILMSPADGDLGAVLGLGFPPFLGGPFGYIDRLGASEIITRMETYRKTGGEQFKPANMLVDYQASGKKFRREE